MANVQQIQQLIKGAVKALGYDLWGVQLISQGRQKTLRIYIDSPQGITVDDCAAVSHQVSGILDVEDPIRDRYTLEVSSPGIDRPLFALAQYQHYVGQFIKVKLRVPFEGRRNFAGMLTGVEGEDIVIQIDDEEYLLPYETIDKANIVSRD